MKLEDFEKNCGLFPCGLETSRRQKTVITIWHDIRGKSKAAVSCKSGKFLEQMAESGVEPQDVAWLVKQGVNINAACGVGLRFADLLAKNNTLSPQMVKQLAELGYNFKRLDEKGRHCGYYAEPCVPLIAALKAQGLDFNAHKDKTGRSAADHIFLTALKNHIKLTPLFETREGIYNCLTKKPLGLREDVAKRIKEVPADDNENFDSSAMMQYRHQVLFRSVAVKKAYEQAKKRRAPHGLKENNPFWENLKREMQNKR